jgi:hypothetical protein
VAATALLALAVALLAAAPADAFRIAGTRWPGRTITYFDASGQTGSVRTAVAAWNRSGVRLRFRPVRRSRAQVLISAQSGVGCAGVAQVGYQPFARQARAILGGGCPDAWGRVQIAAHELGHVLGLAHESRRCALMNPVLFNGAPQRCTEPGTYEYRCGILEPDDVRGAVRLYGGRVRVQHRRPCDLFPAPAAVSALTAAIDPDRSVRIAFRTPPAPRPRVETFGQRDAGQSLQIGRADGACPADPTGLFSPPAALRPRFRYDADDGASLGDAGPPGTRTCVAVRIVDASGRTGPVATAELLASA